MGLMRYQGPLSKPGGKSKAAPISKSYGKPAARGRAEKPKAQPTRYEELKSIVAQFLSDRFKAAEALKEIHDQKLYKKEYKTFEEFCLNEYGMGRSNAYRWLQALDAKQSVEMSGILDKISNSEQASALATVPEKQRARVLKQVAKAGPVTGKAIREVAAGRVIDAEVIKPQAEEKASSRLCVCPKCGSEHLRDE